MIKWPVYDRYALTPGTTVKGPALIEERESTCVIGSGQAATVDAHYNLVADLTS
jgi:N-methylhydantoinase A